MADQKITDLPLSNAELTDQLVVVKDPSGTPTNAKVNVDSIGGLFQAPVQSVNGQQGEVVLTPDELDDSLTSNKFVSAAEKSKLDGIEPEATADQTGAEIKAAYEGEADTNAFTDAEKTKLEGIEPEATADQTGAEIKLAYEGEADTNAYTDAEKSKLAGIQEGAQPNPTNVSELNNDAGYITDTLSGNLNANSNKIVGLAAPTDPNDAASKDYVDQNVGGGGAVNSVNGQQGEVVLTPDDLDDAATTNKFATAAELTKLEGIEPEATADQTGAEIKVAYEGEADTNAFTDAEKTKLEGVQEGAEVNPTNISVFTNDAGYTTESYVDGEIAGLTAAQAGLPDIDGANQIGDSVLRTNNPFGNFGLRSMRVSPDGTKLHLSGVRDTATAPAEYTLAEYDLPNPGTLAGASLATPTYQFDPAESALAMETFTFSLDGLKLYTLRGNVIYEYDVAQPHSLATEPTYTGRSLDISTLMGGFQNTKSVIINSDGTRFCWMSDGPVTRTIHEIVLSTPYEIDSHSGLNHSLSGIFGGTNDYSMSLSADDTQLLISDGQFEIVKEFIFATPGVLSTLASSGKQTADLQPLITGTINITICCHSSRGDRIFVFDNNNNQRIYEVLTASTELPPLIYSAEEIDNRTAKQVDLVEAANVEWDATVHSAYIILDNSVTIDNPLNLKSGATYTLVIEQSVAAPHFVTFGSAFKFPGGTPPVLSGDNTQVDVLRFYCDANKNLHLISASLNSS